MKPSDSKSRHLITAALPYANGPIHLGHLAGAYLPADTYVRYLRSNNKDVAFICGSDEHGAAITLRAKKEHKSPQEIVDQYHELNKNAFADFGITFDEYHRTSDEIHHKTAQDFFLELDKKGAFELKESEQFYDEEFSQFLADRYIQGTCPKCGNPSAYGDQCEKCGSTLSPNELIDPVSTLSKKAPTLKTTRHWYLPMQQEEGWLKEWIEEGKLAGSMQHDPKSWRKPVIGQCKSWIDGGLQSRAMSRDLDWGVKVPLEGAEGKVLYVWLDAPIGYISATKDWGNREGKNWRDYWQSADSRLIHFIGKDNIVFHCIIFPILLKKHGKFILAENVPANEFLNLEGEKISTSRNWAVWLHEYLSDLQALKNHKDVLRYVLTSIAPETKDSEFTWNDFQSRNNSELVAIYGNFVNRVLVLNQKYYGGEVPEANSLSSYQDIIDQMRAHIDRCTDNLEAFRFRDAIQNAMSLARLGNKFLADEEPWKLIKTEPEKVKVIIHLGLQIAANCAIIFSPFLPDSSAQLASYLSLGKLAWTDLGRADLLSSGTKLPKGDLLFSILEDDSVQAQLNKLQGSKVQNQNASDDQTAKKSLNMKDPIEFDDFLKLDLRVGTIIKAEKIEKSNKLLRLKIDLGAETRNVLSGIAKHYQPEELIDRQVQLVINLKPRKIMGELSEGMVLMGEDEDGKLSLIGPDKAVSNGSAVS